MASERDPFTKFEQMRRELDELFGDYFDRPGYAARRPGFTPAVDVYFSSDPPRVIVKAELAEIDLDELTLNVRGRELTIAGQRNPTESEGRTFQQVEIERGPFRRVIGLGADVEPDQARAVYEDGILHIELPIKVEEGQHRFVRIEVSGGDEK
jgi:HSP20 family protein